MASTTLKSRSKIENNEHTKIRAESKNVMEREIEREERVTHQFERRTISWWEYATAENIYIVTV